MARGSFVGYDGGHELLEGGEVDLREGGEGGREGGKARMSEQNYDSR